jgi:hypothetical protein
LQSQMLKPMEKTFPVFAASIHWLQPWITQVFQVRTRS